MCHFIRGFYAGFLEGYLNKKVKRSEQLTCRAPDAPYCTFETALEWWKSSFFTEIDCSKHSHEVRDYSVATAGQFQVDLCVFAKFCHKKVFRLLLAVFLFAALYLQLFLDLR